MPWHLQFTPIRLAAKVFLLGKQHDHYRDIRVFLSHLPANCNCNWKQKVFYIHFHFHILHSTFQLCPINFKMQLMTFGEGTVCKPAISQLYYLYPLHTFDLSIFKRVSYRSHSSQSISFWNRYLASQTTFNAWKDRCYGCCKIGQVILMAWTFGPLPFHKYLSIRVFRLTHTTCCESKAVNFGLLASLTCVWNINRGRQDSKVHESPKTFGQRVHLWHGTHIFCPFHKSEQRNWGRRLSRPSVWTRPK